MPSYETDWDAVNVKTKEEANQALADLILTAQKDRPDLSHDEIQAIQLSNIGYFFGYLGGEDRLRAMELYPEAEHPVFGRRFDLGADIFFKAGMVLVETLKAGQSYSEAIEAARKVIPEDKKER